MTVEKDEAIEIKPFMLNYDSRAGLLDFRPKAVESGPKEQNVDVPSVDPPVKEEAQDALPLEESSPPVVSQVVKPKSVQIPPSKSLNTIQNALSPAVGS